jgi:predicted O-methyltransferase YrrM
VHPGSKETYEYIADWIAPDFFFSKNDFWHRMGMLGVFGDYVLSCTPGDVLEIGVGESSIYLGKVAKKYGRKIFHCDLSPCKIQNPLTVPGYLEKDIATFYEGSSDDFFENVRLPRLALVFIDGDHHYEQVKKDFWSAVPHIVENGYILLHDTHPPDESYLSPDSACGDVYRLRQEIEDDLSFDVITLPKGTAMGVGLTICRKRPANPPHYQDKL